MVRQGLSHFSLLVSLVAWLGFRQDPLGADYTSRLPTADPHRVVACA